MSAICICTLPLYLDDMDVGEQLVLGEASCVPMHHCHRLAGDADCLVSSERSGELLTGGHIRQLGLQIGGREGGKEGGKKEGKEGEKRRAESEGEEYSP